MFPPHSKSRLATVVLVMASIAAGGFTPPAPCAANLLVTEGSCGTGRACCCETDAARPACCCQTDREPPVPLPAPPDDPGQLLKWLHCGDAAALSVTPLPTASHRWAAAGALRPGSAASIQALLCIWRT